VTGKETAEFWRFSEACERFRADYGTIIQWLRQFMLLFVFGIDRAFNRFGNIAKVPRESDVIPFSHDEVVALPLSRWTKFLD
jgi:hypothetical protein